MSNPSTPTKATKQQQFVTNFLKLAGVSRQTTPEENELIWTKFSTASLHERSMFIQYLKTAQHTPKDNNILTDFEDIITRVKC